MQKKMWYKVSYLLTTLDDDGPEWEHRYFKAPDDEKARDIGRKIGRIRMERINRRGGLANVLRTEVKRSRKPAAKKAK